MEAPLRLALAALLLSLGCSSSSSTTEASTEPGGAAGGGAGGKSGASGQSGAAGQAAAGQAGGAGEAGAGQAGGAGEAGAGAAGNGGAGQAGAGGAGAAGKGGGASGDAIQSLQVVVKTGDKVGDGTNNPVKLCLKDGAGGCFKLENEWQSSGAPHDDFVRGVRDHFDIDPGKLSKSEIKYVSLETTAGDEFNVDCVAVVADGELLYCRDGLGVSIGTGNKLTWKDSKVEKSCGSCYRGGARLTHGPMVGHTNKSSARIWMRTGSAVPVRVRYGTGSDLANAKLTDEVTPAQGGDFTAEVVVDGLEPGKRYFYTPVVGASDYYKGDYPSFNTAPDGPAEFTVAFGSCSNFERINGKEVPLEAFQTAYPIYDEILKFTTKPSASPRGPDLLLLIGDNHYGNTFSPRGHGFFYRETRDQKQFAEVLRHVPTLAVWDDHDFGTNNSYGAQHVDQRDGVVKAFRRYWANPPSTEPGIWFKVSWGGVDFFMLDDRYFREPGGANKPDAAMLGKQQFDWLVDGVTASKAPFKVIASGSMWSSHANPAPGEDTWASHPVELKKLIDTFEKNKVDGVVLLSGDKHRSAVYLHRAADGAHPPIYELMSSGLSGAENSCTGGANEKLCVGNHGPTFGRLRFKMGQKDPELLYQIAGPEFGVWGESLTLKASQLAAK